MSTTYTPAPEVEEVAVTLIGEYHPHLEEAPIVYVFRDPPAKSSGKEVWGKARIISGLNAFLAGEHGNGDPFIVIEIALDIWKSLDPARQHALVDHELSHCLWDHLKGPATTGHDVEEFAAVIARHGLWTSMLDTFVRAGQLRIELEGGPTT